jgi:hypothetical protein
LVGKIKEVFDVFGMHGMECLKIYPVLPKKDAFPEM